MREQDNVEVPSFGPADPSLVKQAPEKKLGEGVIAQSVNAEQAKKGKGFILFVVLLLAAVVAGLGYWGTVQQSQIQKQQALLSDQSKQVESLSTQIVQLQHLLKSAESSVEQSDESLLEWVNNRATAADKKIKLIDEQLAALQTQVKEQTSKQLTSQAATLEKLNAGAADQSKSLAALTTRLAAVETLGTELDSVNKAASTRQQNVDKLGKDLAGLNAGLEKQIKTVNTKLASLEKSLKAQDKSLKATSKKLSGTSGADSKQLSQVRANLAALSADYQILSEGQELQRVALSQQGKDLNRRIDQLGSKSTQSSGVSASTLERRVKVNEQAVKAIDGSRLVLNKELLRIRQRLNNLQLQVESLQ
ncbi:hypothetical protein [Aliamphritea ceti]|uniref:hypothetical protein n=1 Tax=Aliamphritea ceti TaxID=1524258 RepID=UPI0021C42A24|nr:hypothetical protein [Aliamphritea ceti]